MNIIQEGPILMETHQSMLSLSFTADEIKKAIWSIPEDKAPGIDGFNSGFYKAARPVVGEDFIAATKKFFMTGNLPKDWNVTAITLIPKIQSPTGLGNYRPISFCNVIYKCISKLICSRLKLVLGAIISPNQGAFVKGRSILHNILLCQDIVKHYGRKYCMPRCLLKMDLRKAYDTLNWDFLKDMMHALNFPNRFIKIVIYCVTSTQYSLMINGSPTETFKAKRGVRQGDPMPPSSS